MGFSGGGSNVLKNHKHDATVVQDGGSLDADNVTSADLTAGDMMYSDGTHLQRLAKGTTLQQLRMNGAATIPEWFSAAAASSPYEFLAGASVTAGTSLPVTFTEVQPPDYVVAVFEGTVTVGQGNDIDINADTSSIYSQIGSYQIGTTQTNLSTLNQVRWNGCISSIAGSGFTVRVELHTNAQTSETHAFIDGFSDMQGTSSLRGKSTTTSTGITQVRFFGGSNFTGTLNCWAVRN
jgi:hypothetical protein